MLDQPEDCLSIQVLDVETFDGQHRKDNASGTAAEQSKNSPPDSSLTVKLYSAKKGYYEGQVSAN